MCHETLQFQCKPHLCGISHRVTSEWPLCLIAILRLPDTPPTVRRWQFSFFLGGLVTISNFSPAPLLVHPWPFSPSIPYVNDFAVLRYFICALMFSFGTSWRFTSSCHYVSCFWSRCNSSLHVSPHNLELPHLKGSIVSIDGNALLTIFRSYPRVSFIKLCALYTLAWRKKLHEIIASAV